MKYKPTDDFDMHARPSLVNCGAEVGNCLVFSHEDSLLFFSLKQNITENVSSY